MMIKIATWNIRGMSTSFKQDEVKMLILENDLSMRAVVETHLNKKLVNNVCDRTFSRWSWLSNSIDSCKGCRIVVGWESNVVEANLLFQSGQVMHFEVKCILDKKNVCVFCLW